MDASAGAGVAAGVPVSLGSWWGLIPFPIFLVLIILRLKNEEKYLFIHLPRYGVYCNKVTYILIPYIW